MFLFNFIQTFQTIQSFFPGLLVGYIVLRHRNNEETPRKNLAKKFLIFIVVLLYSLALYFTIAKQVQRMPICLSVFFVYLSVYMSVCLFICLSVCPFFMFIVVLLYSLGLYFTIAKQVQHLSICLSVFSVYLSVYMSVCLFICLSVCPFFIFIVVLLYSLRLYFTIAKQVQCMSICLSVCILSMYVCLSFCPSICFVFFIVVLIYSLSL
jgi:hypothetical protein